MGYQLARAGFGFLFAPLLALYLALAIPIFGHVAFDHLAHDALAGCEHTTEGLIKSCQINGVGAGKVSGAYIASTLLVGIANPLIALKAIPVIVPRNILLPWLGFSILLWAVQRRLRREA